MSGSQTPAPGAGPAKEPAGADPSMEDILASIRRILSEDVPQPASDGPAAPEETPSDVLVLDASMMVAEPPQPAPVQAQAPVPIRPAATLEPPAEPYRPPAVTPPPAPPPHAADTDESLVAPEVMQAAASSMSGLMRRLSAERGTLVRSGGPTIEDMVREELRPMLKEWLDANLSPLVERLVKAEIERVIGRAVP